MVNGSLKNCHIYYFGQHDHWPMEKVGEWVKQASGNPSTSLTDKTTHVLVPEKAWLNQSKLVQEVLAHKAKGYNIHILQYEWLGDCLEKKHRLGEAKYSWEKANGKRQSNAENGGESRSQSGLVKSLYTEATDGFVNERDQRRIEKQQAAEEKARKEDEAAKKLEFEKKRNKLRIAEVAAVFRRGAQRARNEILSDNHHIYMDTSGFSYDIAMTKVDTKKNTNERYVLTIYESNAIPHTYALNCQFAGTGKDKVNNIIAAIGSTHDTAFRAFKKIFKEKTRVGWEDRVRAAVERSKKEKAGNDQQQEDFADAPYFYHPPHYGSRGEFPKAQEASHDNGDAMMSGGNGMGQEPSQLKEDDKYDDSDLNRFMRVTQDFAQKGTEGIVEDAFEDPFPFGTYANLNDQIGFDTLTQSFQHTQVAKQARDDFLQFVQDDSSVLGKRKTGEMLSGGNAASKKSKNGNVGINSSHGHGENTLQYSFDDVGSQHDGETPRDTDESVPNRVGDVDFSAINFGLDSADQVQ